MSTPPTAATISLSGLSATGRHGVFDHERANGQTFVVDLRLALGQLVDDDELSHTVNYARVAQQVHAIITGEPVNLIETLAQRIADEVLSEHPLVLTIEVTVHKPEAPIEVAFSDVAVTVTSHRLAARETHPLVLAFGGNIGDAAATIEQAIDDLDGHPQIAIDAVSSFYRTAPWGVLEQADFINCVATGRTSLTPPDLITATRSVEDRHGRQRTGERNGPRTLDIDVIDMAGQDYVSEAITVPHPRAADRAFVLVPWLEADAQANLSLHGPVATLVGKIDTDGVCRLDRRPRLPHHGDAREDGRP